MPLDSIFKFDNIQILRIVLFYQITSACVLATSDHQKVHYCMNLSIFYKTWLDSAKNPLMGATGALSPVFTAVIQPFLQMTVH